MYASKIRLNIPIYFHKRFFPSGNFPRVFFQVATSPICNFPNGNLPSLSQPQRSAPACFFSGARPPSLSQPQWSAPPHCSPRGLRGPNLTLVNCRLGNCTFRKLPLGKMPLGKQLTPISIMLQLVSINIFKKNRKLASKSNLKILIFHIFAILCCIPQTLVVSNQVSKIFVSLITDPLFNRFILNNFRAIFLTFFLIF